jgi:hypothetical protein
MTARDGFSHDMYRFALDAEAADRLMAGSVDIADAPPPFRAIAVRLQALREAPESWELAGEQDAVEQIAAAVMLERQARSVRRSRRSSSRVAVLAATAVVVCALPLTGGLASAGALPKPAQDVASTVLDKVGISVPTGAPDPVDDAPPPVSPVPAPPSTTGSSPGAGGSSPGADGPVPDVPKSPPGVPNPTAPGNGEGDHHGTRARGTPPNEEDHDANTEGGHGGAHAPDDTPDGGNGNGNGHDR